VAPRRSREDQALLLLVIGISLAFAWILWPPLYGAVPWATVIAILFAPLRHRLSRSLNQRRSLAALATVTIIVLIVIVLLALLTASLVQEASGLYERIQSGRFSVRGYFEQLIFWLLGLHAPLLWAVVMAVLSLLPWSVPAWCGCRSPSTCGRG
jgi:predicted PurR-regulated permease PerM